MFMHDTKRDKMKTKTFYCFKCKCKVASVAIFEDSEMNMKLKRGTLMLCGNCVPKKTNDDEFINHFMNTVFGGSNCL